MIEEATSARRVEVAEGRARGERSGGSTAGLDGLDALQAREGVRPGAAHAASRNPRAKVVLFATVLVAAIGALAVHVAQGVLAEKRLASLAVATRVAPPSAPAPLNAPVASTAAPLRVLPGVASTAPVASLAPVPPAPPVAEPNDWDAVPALAPVTRTRRAAEARAAALRAPEPAPVAAPCSAAVIALGLCTPVQNP
jgi:hypothetical protein